MVFDKVYACRYNLPSLLNDMLDFVRNIGTDEAKKLESRILKAINDEPPEDVNDPSDGNPDKCEP